MNKKTSHRRHAVIIGAGPAGLTAGIELLKTEQFNVSMLEREHIVGGLARTIDYKGYKYDIAPNHFVTDAPRIQQWWHGVMGKEFIQLKRGIRRYWHARFIGDALSGAQVARGLSMRELLRTCIGLLRVRLFPIRRVQSFRDCLSNQFGRRFFSIFFKSYAEKVWGIPCHKISADLAAEYMSGFSLRSMLFHAFFGRWLSSQNSSAQDNTFYYPTKGTGMLWNRVATQICARKGGDIRLREEVVSIEHDSKRIFSVSTAKKCEETGMARKLSSYTGDEFLSTMPLKSLVLSLDPLPPGEVVEAARALAYRGLITINLIVKRTDLFADQWLHIHENSVQVARIGNMNNLSSEMVADQSHTALSLEYFAFAHDDLWKKTDQELIALGTQELAQIGLAEEDEVADGFVMRTPDAYPVYDTRHCMHLDTVLSYLSRFENLSLMKRSELHQYNNMDQAMHSAFDTVEQVLKKVGDAGEVHGQPQPTPLRLQGVHVAKKLT